MYTQKQYMANEVSHYEYYSQFVTPHIEGMVKRFLEEKGWPDPAKAISADQHLNQIPLRYWDRLCGDVFGIHYTDGIGKQFGYHGMLNQTGREFVKQLKEAGDSFSAAEMVCTLKAAVRHLAETK